ncbi:uncharacterized protein BYT42DRAFT_572019 [Radiomyces spectabilis]|uniref:uncharacterized protein n=1 Tax=Radiomyces spectabilis TaxID=64574 RepID=UPI00221E4113|nr:uncharacterized protein BYT42DRAFT_572019 [Radiomyces spectabilis]KAI8377878.1 hypothetical protein BYT42DRAFT_572019 [Radiomyces spectabilis]
MGTRAIDYRVSAIVVLCKDCGNDVGLYPARHVCHDNQRPLLPASGDSDSGSSFASHRSQRPWISRHGSDASISSVESMKKTRVSSSSDEDDPQHESIYYKHFEACLPPTTGKRLWGVVRQNEKFKELNEKSNTH